MGVILKKNPELHLKHTNGMYNAQLQGYGDKGDSLSLTRLDTKHYLAP